MDNTTYEKLRKDDLILRDHLALDRTELSNENTLLAYIRTFLAIIITGASLLKFFDTLPINILGWVIIFIGILVLFYGFYRFNNIKRNIHKIR